MNDGEAMKKRHAVLLAKLRREPNAPAKKADFTLEEMDAAAKYMLSLTGTSNPMPS